MTPKKQAAPPAQAQAKPQKVDAPAIQKSLAAFSRKLSAATPKRRGAILLTFTDLGEQCCLDGTAQDFRVIQGMGDVPPTVSVSGPSRLLQSIMDGKKEASRAFIAGGIQVSGDLDYLEELLKQPKLLNCD